MLDAHVGFIGGGQMARALAHGFTRSKLLKPTQIHVHDPSSEAVAQFSDRLEGCCVDDDNAGVVGHCDVIFLAVKPQNFDAVTAQLQSKVTPEKLFVSILAGVSLSRLSARLGTNRLIRVMPNTPCLIGKGASGFALGAGATAQDGELVEQLMSSIGIAFQLDESLLDAVTGLSGSGPAYVFTIVEALSDGGVRMGLPRAVATELAVQTILGAAEMVRSSEDHPAQLRDRVTSPGGTTIAGLQKLEEYRIRAGLIAAVEAATQRSQELGQ